MKILEIAEGTVFAPARFSLVRISIRDLAPDGKSLVRNSGGGDENLILSNVKNQKNPRTHKIKSAFLPPPPKTPNPSTMRNFMDMEVLLQKERIFSGAHKIGAAASGPRIADKKFYGHEDFSEEKKEGTFRQVSKNR